MPCKHLLWKESHLWPLGPQGWGCGGTLCCPTVRKALTLPGVAGLEAPQQRVVKANRMKQQS